MITGEGSLDGQSLQGKACLRLASIASEFDVPTVALVGKVDVDAAAALSERLLAFFSICNGPISLVEAMSNASALVETSAMNVTRCILGGRSR